MSVPSVAYEFAHVVIREAALRDPLLFLWASRLPGAAHRLQNIWKRMAAERGSDEGCEDLTVRVDGDVPTLVVTVGFPTPRATAEAHFGIAFIDVPTRLVDEINAAGADVPARDALDRALQVIMGTTDADARRSWNLASRYFTLEHSVDALRDVPCTMLCEWQLDDEGRDVHRNLGTGPAPDRLAFLRAVVDLLRDDDDGTTMGPADA